mgnify:CR=1 FL=1
MFYSLLVWMFSKPKGRVSKPSPLLESVYLAIMILMLALLNGCHA